MSRRKPVPFEDLDDQIFQQLPINYALMEPAVDGKMMRVAPCSRLQTLQYYLHPPDRPISCLADLEGNTIEG